MLRYMLSVRCYCFYTNNLELQGKKSGGLNESLWVSEWVQSHFSSSLFPWEFEPERQCVYRSVSRSEMTRVPGNARITVPSVFLHLTQLCLWETPCEEKKTTKKTKQSSTFFSGFPSERVCGDSLALSKPAHWIQNNTAKEKNRNMPAHH